MKRKRGVHARISPKLADFLTYESERTGKPKTLITREIADLVIPLYRERGKRKKKEWNLEKLF